MVKKLTISKAPQCRHKDEFVSYDEVDGWWSATCSNCNQSSATRWKGDTVSSSKELARYDLMRQIGDPAVIYENAP